MLKRSILTERLARRGHHLSRDYSVDPFELMRVKDVMVVTVDTLSSTMLVSDVIEFFMTEEPRHKSYPVIDSHQVVLGMVTRADVLKWTLDSHYQVASLGELISNEIMTSTADELVGQLADRMAQHDVGRVPVIDKQTHRLIGLVARKDLLRVRAHMLTSEHSRSAPLRTEFDGSAHRDTTPS